MMEQAKPLNKLLIGFTLVVAIFADTFATFTAPRYYSDWMKLVIGLVGIALAPVMIVWIRAVWNTLVPRITGWREISSWEATGIMVLLILLARW